MPWITTAVGLPHSASPGQLAFHCHRQLEGLLGGGDQLDAFQVSAGQMVLLARAQHQALHGRIGFHARHHGLDGLGGDGVEHVHSPAGQVKRGEQDAVVAQLELHGRWIGFSHGVLLAVLPAFDHGGDAHTGTHAQGGGAQALPGALQPIEQGAQADVQPVAPSGWPMAIEPPLTMMRAGWMSSARAAFIGAPVTATLIFHSRISLVRRLAPGR